MDYLSELAQWRAYCAVEDTIVGCVLISVNKLKFREIFYNPSFHFFSYLLYIIFIISLILSIFIIYLPFKILLHFNYFNYYFSGRFSLRGSELGWTKSWFMNLGLGEESTAKIKLRMGLNLKSYKVLLILSIHHYISLFNFNYYFHFIFDINLYFSLLAPFLYLFSNHFFMHSLNNFNILNYQAYARVRFRTEPLSTFDIGEGLSCAGKIPLPGLLPILRSIPLRVEYRLRINTPQPDIHIRRGKKEGTVRFTYLISFCIIFYYFVFCI